MISFVYKILSVRILGTDKTLFRLPTILSLLEKSNKGGKSLSDEIKFYRYPVSEQKEFYKQNKSPSTIKPDKNEKLSTYLLYIKSNTEALQK